MEKMFYYTVLLLFFLLIIIIGLALKYGRPAEKEKPDQEVSGRGQGCEQK